MKIKPTRTGIAFFVALLAGLFALSQFSPIGMLIYAVYAAFVIAVAAILPWRTFLKDKVWKWWVILPIAVPLLVAPVAEEMWIEYHFEEACKDAGLHVKRKVEVAGYYNATTLDTSNEDKIIKDESLVKYYTKELFSYEERRTMTGKVRHREIVNDTIEQTILDAPRARYHLRQTSNHRVIGHRLKKFERDVYDSIEDEVIARKTSYARYSNTIENIWLHFLGDGQIICHVSLNEPNRLKRGQSLIPSVLLPRKDNYQE
jgi:hypothetical protein